MAGIDFEALRSTTSMGEVLELIGFVPRTKLRRQWRGPCPCHESTSDDSRVFSVNLERNSFRCFKCGAAGNHLDLWVLMTKKPLYDAAVDLCEKLHRDVPWLDSGATRQKAEKRRRAATPLKSPFKSNN